MKIAIVKLSALGDIVHAMIVLQYIKKQLPHAQIDWIVEEKFMGILENNPHINTIYPICLKSNAKQLFQEYLKLKKIAKQNRYDIVLDLQGLIKSAIVARILGHNSIGFDKNSAKESFASWWYKTSFAIAYEENVIIRNLTLVRLALKLDPFDITHKEPFLFSSTQSSLKPELLIITGSSWASKVYPKEHFVTIINALNVKTFVVWGNDKEEEDARYLCAHSQALMLPKMSLDELKAVIHNSTLIIGADTGPTHMAWALGRSSITIFGPTPSTRNTITTPINLTIDCQQPIDARNINKNNFCIQNINPNDIIALAKRLLSC